VLTRLFLQSALLSVLALQSSLARAEAPQPGRLIHPLWASTPDAPWDSEARVRFQINLRKMNLGIMETVDVARPPAPRAAALLQEGQAAVEKQQFEKAREVLDAAVAEAISTGAAGLSREQLADLFLYQGMAIQKADWKDLPAPPTEIAPPEARQAYLRAAVFAPDRVLVPRRFPPLAIASWQKAIAEVNSRPRATLIVRAPERAQIFLDGGAAQSGPASLKDVPMGEHFVRVEEVGFLPWGTLLGLTKTTLEIDRPPVAPLVFDDKEAAAHARRMNTSFALYAQLHMAAQPQVELHLVDAQTGQQRDATVLPFDSTGDHGEMLAALMKLDERARTLDLERREAAKSVLPLTKAPPPPSAPISLRNDPEGWFNRRWPLVAAIGVAALSCVVLGIAASR
jgi:hypothetical protein